MTPAANSIAASTAPGHNGHRILVYGDSLTWGWIPTASGFPSARYPSKQQWPSVMQEKLGGGYTVLTEALPGRTTDRDDPCCANVTGAGLNGAAYLPAALASHLPLDLVVIMLGTNDLKFQFGKTPEQVAAGVSTLIKQVQNANGGVGTSYPNPKVLLISPPVIAKERVAAFDSMYNDRSYENSKELAKQYSKLAETLRVDFLDANKVAPTDGIDGLHLSSAAEANLGIAVAEKVRTMFAPVGSN
ncbi:SGNH/GDSL hydrolase family protein [Paraburkholderia strydomiana]